MITDPQAPPAFRVLGSLGYNGPDAHAVQPLLRQPKRATVLIYLLVEGGSDFVSRDDLVDLFWPGTDDARARNALRQTLAFLRTHLGRDAIRNRGRQYVRASAARVACDATLFEERIEEGSLADALSLYRGEFLAGLHIAGCPALHAWLEERRSYYRGRAAQAAWDLAVACVDSGRPYAAAYWGKRALAYSTFGEMEVRRLITLLDRVGDRAGALRAYQGLERYLADEFGCQPSPETRQLMDEVLTRMPRTVDAPAPGSTRRSGVDRRRTHDRRVIVLPWVHAERRQAHRRQGERRRKPDRRSFRQGA